MIGTDKTAWWIAGAAAAGLAIGLLFRRRSDGMTERSPSIPPVPRELPPEQYAPHIPAPNSTLQPVTGRPADPPSVTRTMPREDRCGCTIKTYPSKGGSVRHAMICKGSPMPRYVSREVAEHFKGRTFCSRDAGVQLMKPFNTITGSVQAKDQWNAMRREKIRSMRMPSLRKLATAQAAENVQPVQQAAGLSGR